MLLLVGPAYQQMHVVHFCPDFSRAIFYYGRSIWIIARCVHQRPLRLPRVPLLLHNRVPLAPKSQINGATYISLRYNIIRDNRNVLHMHVLLNHLNTSRAVQSWLRHQMETYSALLPYAPVTGEFPSQRPVTRSFDYFFIYEWANLWVSNRDPGDLRRHRAQYDFTIMFSIIFF